jgi:hypothetical protein
MRYRVQYAHAHILAATSCTIDAVIVVDMQPAQCTCSQRRGFSTNGVHSNMTDTRASDTAGKIIQVLGLSKKLPPYMIAQKVVRP